MITSIRLVNVSTNSYNFNLCVVRTFKIYSLSNVQIYNTVLLTWSLCCTLYVQILFTQIYNYIKIKHLIKNNARFIATIHKIKSESGVHMASYRTGIRSWLAGRVWPTAWLCEWPFTGTQLCSLTYLCSMAAVWNTVQTCVVSVRTMWPTKPKTFTMLPFLGNNLRPLI